MRKLLTTLTVCLGLCAAAARAFQILHVFEVDTGLAAPWHRYTLILLGVCGVFAVISIVLTHAASKQIPERKNPGILWLLVEVSAVAMLLGSVLDPLIEGFKTTSAMLLVYGTLGVLTAISVLINTSGVLSGKLQPTSGYGFWATIPVFWACYTLIVDFWNHAGNPVLLSYMFGMLGYVFCALGLYGHAGQYFERIRPGRTAFYCTLAAFLSILTAAGSLAALYMLPGEAPPNVICSKSDLLRLGFVALHCLAVMGGTLGGIFNFKYEAKRKTVDITHEIEDDFQKGEIAVPVATSVLCRDNPWDEMYLYRTEPEDLWKPAEEEVIKSESEKEIDYKDMDDGIEIIF